jgi:hypothetical protein
MSRPRTLQRSRPFSASIMIRSLMRSGRPRRQRTRSGGRPAIHRSPTSAYQVELWAASHQRASVELDDLPSSVEPGSRNTTVTDSLDQPGSRSTTVADPFHSGEPEPPIRRKSPFQSRTGSSRFRGCPISQDHTDRGDLGFDGHAERLLPGGTCPFPVSRMRRSRREAVTFKKRVAYRMHTLPRFTLILWGLGQFAKRLVARGGSR